MGAWSAERIGALAHEAMLFEVAATPKPGLVDRATNGAHEDMDIFTFLRSAAALRHTFEDFAALGAEKSAEDLPTLFSHLQAAGQSAERGMFAATDNINTHKGLIYSLGLLSAAAGYADARGEAISPAALCALVARMTAGMTAKAYESAREKDPSEWTKGEAMYFRYGVSGVRGEAESGFATVQATALPVYRARRAAGWHVNDAFCDTLLALLAYTVDTNILGRAGEAGLRFAQREAGRAVALGGMGTEAGRKAIEEMDRAFTVRRISPGGCADLLAVTHFLHAFA